MSYYAPAEITQAEALIHNFTLILIGNSKVFVSHLRPIVGIRYPADHWPLPHRPLTAKPTVPQKCHRYVSL
jgi:hypothetical protein